MRDCRQCCPGFVSLDFLLSVFVAFVFVCLVLLEVFHIRTHDRVVFQEDRCVRKNLRALRKAQEMLRVVNPQAEADGLKELMNQVILFAEKNTGNDAVEGCWVEVNEFGQGEVIHPLMDENGRIASDGKVVVRFNGGDERVFEEGNFTYRLACPAKGEYRVGVEGGSPRCNVPGHILGSR